MKYLEDLITIFGIPAADAIEISKGIETLGKRWDEQENQKHSDDKALMRLDNMIALQSKRDT